MISKISYTEEGGLYTQLDGEATDIEYNNTERLIILKLNEVIDELNRQQQHITNVGEAVSLLEQPKESANFVHSGDMGRQPATVTTSNPTGQVTYVAANPPKKEETPIITIEKLLEAGIADYKKRLVEKLKQNYWIDDDGKNIRLELAIIIVKETE